MKIKALLLIALAFIAVSSPAQTKKKKPVVLAATAPISVPVAATPAPAEVSAGIPRPKIVVGIVVDQMRWDYLYRYYDRYTNAGFKRLLNEGFSCENTQVDYIPTNTGPGHSCIYTGSVPALHSIAGNDFIDQATGLS